MIAQISQSFSTFRGKFVCYLEECPSIVRIGYFFFVVSGGIIISVVTTIVRIRAIIACILLFPFGLILFVGGVINLLCIKILWIFIGSVGWSFWLPRSPLHRGTIIYLAIDLFLHMYFLIVVGVKEVIIVLSYLYS